MEQVFDARTGAGLDRRRSERLQSKGREHVVAHHDAAAERHVLARELLELENERRLLRLAEIVGERIDEPSFPTGHANDASGRGSRELGCEHRATLHEKQRRRARHARGRAAHLRGVVLEVGHAAARIADDERGLEHRAGG